MFVLRRKVFLTLGLITSLVSPAYAEAKDAIKGPAGSDIEARLKTQNIVLETEDYRAGVRTSLYDRIVHTQVFYSKPYALAFIYSCPPDNGCPQQALDQNAQLWHKVGKHYTFIKEYDGVYGAEVSSAQFRSKTIVVKTKSWKFIDSGCCPTQRNTFVLKRP